MSIQDYVSISASAKTTYVFQIWQAFIRPPLLAWAAFFLVGAFSCPWGH